jgi:hypothetical protein
MWRLEAPCRLGLVLGLGLEQTDTTWKFRSMKQNDVHRKNLQVGQDPWSKRMVKPPVDCRGAECAAEAFYYQYMSISPLLTAVAWLSSFTVRIVISSS